MGKVHPLQFSYYWYGFIFLCGESQMMVWFFDALLISLMLKQKGLIWLAKDSSIGEVGSGEIPQYSYSLILSRINIFIDFQTPTKILSLKTSYRCSYVASYA